MMLIILETTLFFILDLSILIYSETSKAFDFYDGVFVF